MILILTEASDDHADLVSAKLRERGATFTRFDPGQFPAQAALSLSYSPTGQIRRTLRTGAGPIDLNGLETVWFRHPGQSVAHPAITDGFTRTYVEEECRTFLQDLWNGVAGLWVPACPPVLRRAELKASQLQLAADIGFEIPPTLFTNDPEEVLAFYQEHHGNIVSKLASSTLYRLAPARFCRYTGVVTRCDLGHVQAVRYCPLIFQAYVPKQLELRITVVGRQMFPAEIHSQQTRRTRHDWRRNDYLAALYRPHDLPADITRCCLELVERLGLCYGAIDMVRTPDGRYVFLEINPNGEYLWVEQLTGLPISDAICDLLMSGTHGLAPAGKVPIRIGDRS